MATTYELIKGETLASSAASYTFSAIPSTYTDLVVRISGRTDLAAWDDTFEGRINTTASTHSTTVVGTFNTGSAVSVYSARTSGNTFTGGDMTAASNTANTFASVELYFPNYAGSAQKVFSINTATEANATYRGSIQARAGLWSQTSVMSSLYLVANGSFVAGSSFYLYGIKNS